MGKWVYATNAMQAHASGKKEASGHGFGEHATSPRGVVYEMVLNVSRVTAWSYVTHARAPPQTSKRVRWH